MLNIRKLKRYLVNLASGFCFLCVCCDPHHVAAEMILYTRFCEMEYEHAIASRGHYNSSVHDLFYFIVFLILDLEFVWTKKSWV